MLPIVLLAIALAQSPPKGQHEQPPSEHKTESAKPPSPYPQSLENKNDSKEQSKWWPPPPAWDIYWPTFGLLIATGIAVWTAVRTLKDMDAQIREMRATGQQTDALIKENIAQSASLERSVRETARFATAMEGVATSLEATAELSGETVKGLRQQMRAYVTTSIGGALFQERAKKIRFGASVLFNNNGLTPAHKVRHKAKAAILPNPLPNNFAYPLPEAYAGETIMGPRQQNSVNTIVDDFIDDAEVDNVKAGNGRALYVWGIIEYEDVFGEHQQTRFCQVYAWLQDGKTVWGYYVSGHNDGT